MESAKCGGNLHFPPDSCMSSLGTILQRMSTNTRNTQRGLIGYFIFYTNTSLDIDNTIIYYNLLCLSSTNNPRDEGRPADTSPVTNRLHVENDWRDPAGRINCALFVVYCLDIIYTLFKFKSSTSLVSFH